MVVTDCESDDLALANLRKTWANKHEHIQDFLKYLTGYQECPGDCGRPDLEVIGRSRGRITWDKPNFEGSSPIIAYKVEVAYESKASRWIQLGISPSCEMLASGLEEGGLWIRVSAGNVHGYGPPRQSGMLMMRPEPGPPVIVNALECQTLDEDTLKLSCQITGYPIPTVIWSRGQMIIQDFGGRIKIERDDDVYTMTIGDATQDDSGLYCLEAMNPVGRVTAYSFVSVTKKPRLSGVDEAIYRRPTEVERGPVFELGLKDRTVDAFTTVLLGCQVSGHPQPVVTWFKDGVPLEESDNVVIISDDEFHSVEVSYVRPEDCGEYKCEAHNAFGTVETTCDLQVTGPVEPPTFEHPLEQDVEAIVGSTVRMTTVVSCYTRPIITWLKDGEELRQRKERVASQSTDGTVELCLAYLTEADTGEYTCTATCPAGSAHATYSLRVTRQPTPPPPALICTTPVPYTDQPLFLVRPRCTEVLEGETIRFWVQVVGEPKPKVIWYRDNLKVDYYREKCQFFTESSGPDHWLEIRRCKFPFSGHYSAYASNSHGTVNARFSLQVFAKECRKDLRMEPGVVREAEVITVPIITQPLCDTRCQPGSSVTVECHLKGEPIPDIIWTKNGKVFKHGLKWIEGDTVGLTLNDTTQRDEGIYKCEAWNCLGKASTSAYLTIEREETTIREPVAPCITRSGIDDDDRQNKRGKRASPARFLTVPHNRVVLLGDSVRFICSVAGYPLPNVAWFKDGSPVTTSGRIRVTEDEDVHCLEIDQALLGDAGKYTIVLENKKGSAEASATLQVVSHRRESKMVSKDYYQFGRKYRESKEDQARERQSSAHDQPIQECKATEGSTFTLSCHVGTPTSATWYKDGEPLPEEERGQTWEEDGLARLRLGPLEPSDSGLYSCRLDREWGLAQGLVRLTVTPLAHQEIKPPIFVQGLPRKIITKEGLPCLIRATISGEEPLKVVWSRGSEEELPDCEDLSHVDLGNGEVALRLADTFVEDSGLYTCTVYNCHGMAQSHTRLVVEEDSTEDKSETPARILAGPVDCVVLRGGKAILSALFSGSPLPTVMWSKGGVEVDHNDRVSVQTDMEEGRTNLVIDPVEADDSGKYVLTVYNHLATDYHFASLSVEGVPDPPADRPIVEPRGAGRVAVAWSSPHFDGGSMITGYSVEMLMSSSDQWVNVAERCHSLSYYVSGLSDGETYTFRVRSHNVHGSSDPSAYSQPITLRKAPEHPHGAVEFEDGRLFNERYSKLEELGKGRYGVVHRVRETLTGRDLAAKVVRCIKKVDRDKAAQELAIMNTLRHPKLLQLVAAYDATREIILVLEYISGGELFERVVADDFTLTEKDCILFMRQICEGVAYMHDQSVVHLDLKPENIMCTTRDSHDIKLIDFGLAQKLEDGTPVRVLFGTPEFIAPEIINYEPIGTQTDMWSVGVICYVLLSGLSPFMGDNDAETFANITRADYDFDDEAFDSISHTAKEFICELLVKRKEKRLNAKECLTHKWMSQEDTAMSQVKLCTDKLKKFIIRRKWQKTGNAIRALGRMANLSAASRRGSSSPVMGNRATILQSSTTPPTSVSDNGEKRGRQCSERSDSGFSDCSTTGSLTAAATHLLTDKKYSITEEIEDPIKQLAQRQEGERITNEGLDPGKQTKLTESHHSSVTKRSSKNENVQKAFAFWNR